MTWPQNVGSVALTLSQTCSVLRDIHDNSARLQYDFTLQTSAYLNVPNHPSPLSPTVSSQTPCPATSSSSKPRALRSPHTGIPRPTIPSVTLAPYAHTAPPKSTRSEILSAQEKNKLLTDREKRWETLEAEHVRTFKIAGPAGVYELQEGMFLMCDEYPNKEVGRVSRRGDR